MAPDQRYYPTREWWAVADAYRDAATSLMAPLTPDGFTYQHLPPLYLCRHFLELGLKALMVEIAKALGTPVHVKTIHLLDVLWNDLTSALSPFDGIQEGDINTLRLIVEEFDAYDRKSLYFRYPGESDGRPFNLGFTGVNRSVLERTVPKLDETFKSTALAIQTSRPQAR